MEYDKRGELDADVSPPNPNNEEAAINNRDSACSGDEYMNNAEVTVPDEENNNKDSVVTKSLSRFLPGVRVAREDDGVIYLRNAKEH